MATQYFEELFGAWPIEIPDEDTLPYSDDYVDSLLLLQEESGENQFDRIKISTTKQYQY
jgi:hypothetical protein